MPLSHEHKLVMVHIPKNAGTSIEKCLDMKETGHWDWAHYATKFPSEWKDYKTFAVIREPLDRFVSSYNYASMEESYWHNSDPNKESEYGKHVDYDACVKYELNDIVPLWLDGKVELKHPSWDHQNTMIMDGSSIAVDYLVSFEYVGSAMSVLAPNAVLKKINASSSKRPNQLSSENQKLLREYYSTDYDLYSLLSGQSLYEV